MLLVPESVLSSSLPLIMCRLDTSVCLCRSCHLTYHGSFIDDGSNSCWAQSQNFRQILMLEPSGQEVFMFGSGRVLFAFLGKIHSFIQGTVTSRFVSMHN